MEPMQGTASDGAARWRSTAQRLLRAEATETQLGLTLTFVAGAINASQDYSSGLYVAVYDFGAGRLVLNALRVRENLGVHPAAERLLRNMLRYAARDLGKPPADLPADFEQKLKTLGY